MEKQKQAFAIVALILGIIGLVFSFIPIINNFAFILGIIGLVFGVIALITHNKKGLSIAGIVTSVLAIVITLALQATWSKALDDATDKLNSSLDEASEELSDMSGENTDELLGTAVDVQLGTFTAESDEYGLVTSSLPVTITNLSDDTASYSITIEATNPDGSRINVDYVYADSLGSNQSMTNDVFTYISSDELETYQNVVFKVLEVSKY